ncbi:MAG: SDR family oxidoreductase [Thermoleophilaceae bacterium]|jgi:3-oxoacyl-[acyl-carrier protein] reductase|nr:SDR family oxidoreductase [Thermoleophilaceae bacterium]
MDLGLVRKPCIVTGASRGIGRATARLLAAEGARVLLAARGEEGLTEAVEECRAAVGSSHAGSADAVLDLLALDVTAPDAGERLLARCRERFGEPWAVVCNAGTSAVRPLEQLTDADFAAQWELNAMAPLRLMRAVAPAMAERGGGRIVNVSSSSGKRPSATNVAYSVAKAAQLSLSRAFADAYADRGVLVNAVTPGPVETGLWLDEGGLADQTAAAKGGSREEALAAARAKVPVGRLGTPEEIAAVVAFLCSERTSDVTGAAWSVDGGSVPVIL